MPLKIKLGGAGGTRFGVSYKSYDKELKLEKGLTITSKPAGTPPNVKDVCDFSKYEVPTPEKLGQNLIKAKTELSKLIIAIHNKYEQYTPKIGSTNLDILDDVEEFGTATSGRPKVPASAYMAGTQVTAKIEVSDADMPPY